VVVVQTAASDSVRSREQPFGSTLGPDDRYTCTHVPYCPPANVYALLTCVTYALSTVGARLENRRAQSLRGRAVKLTGQERREIPRPRRTVEAYDGAARPGFEPEV